MLGRDFEKSLSEFTRYVKYNSSEILVVSLYEDDLLITRSSEKIIDEFKQYIMQAFEISDLGLMTCFLGMEITQGKVEFSVCQKKYAKEILKTVSQNIK